MTKTASFALLALAVALSPACGLDEGFVGENQIALADLNGFVAFINDQEATTFERLDVDCQIRSDSARQVIKHRDGRDGQPFTADDNLIESFEELDGISLVGPWTIDRLYACAERFGYVAAPAWVLAAADVPNLVADGLANVGGYATSICEAVVGDATACLGRCTWAVRGAAEQWLTEQVNAWIGRGFASRDEAVLAARSLVADSAARESACWSMGDCAALNGLIACMESD